MRKYTIISVPDTSTEMASFKALPMGTEADPGVNRTDTGGDTGNDVFDRLLASI